MSGMNSPNTKFQQNGRSQSEATTVPLPPPRVPDHDLLRRIGRGAYGEVWLARCAIGAYRAVKIVHRQSFDHDRPFEREFEGILKFEPVSRTHDSQVDILHVGRGEDCFYYVMELADDQATGGQINPDHYTPRTLKSDLQFHGRLPFEECVRIGIALATALQHLHENGLVHRDVKPSNIIFINGVPKLADIGLVTGVDATHTYVGTEGFAAPEGSGTAQADLYGLGKVLYEAATGKDRQEFPELPTLLRELPDRDGLMELNAVVAKACRHDPKDRYSSAAAMRADLELLQSGKSLARLHRTEKRLRFVQRAGAVVTALAALIAGGWLWQARETKVVRQLAQEKEQERRLAQENLYVADIGAAYHDWESGQITRMLDLLRRHIPQNSDPDLRGWEWYYLLSLCHRDERTLRGHTSGVQSVSCDPAGRRFASGNDDHMVRVWDAESGACLAELKGHEDIVFCVAWSPDGTQLASGGRDGKLILWDTENLQKLFVLDCDDAVQALAWSPDGKRIAAGGIGHLPVGLAGLVTVWDTTSGRRLHYLNGHVTDIRSLAWQPGGNSLVAGENFPGKMQVWDADNGQLLRTIQAHNHVLSALAWRPDGRQLASASADQRVRIWDAETWEPVTTIDPAHNGTAAALAWSEDGQRLVSGGADEMVRIWDARTGAPLNALRGHQAAVESVAWWPGHGRILSGSKDGTLKIWNPESEQGGRTVAAPGDPCAWSPDGQQIAVGSRRGNTNVGVIQILDVATWRTQFTLPGITNHFPRGLAWSPNGRQLAASYFVPGQVQVWDLATRKEVLSLPKAHGGGEVRTVAWSPDGRLLATAGLDGAVRLWNVETKENILSFLEHSNSVSSAVWSPDGQWIASKDQLGGVMIWDASTGQVRLKLQCPTGFSAGKQYTVSWSPQGDRLAAAGGDGTVMVWDVANGREPHALKGHTSAVRSVQWSPDGRRLVSGAEDRTIRIWDPQSGRELLVLPDPHNKFPSVAWSPSGRMIGVGDDSALVYDASIGYELAPTLAPARTNR
jgi:WD40 repeat protein